jgi:UDP-N-acetylmuramoylalanine--D-glutamate ligase
MDKAVEAAVSHAEPGDAVVLSPGAASFGMFRHEFERGDVFKDACRRIALF